MDFTMAISFGRFAFLKLTDFTDFCKNSVACETFLWYDNVCKFKELANAQIAQLVEQRTENPRVAGSIPALGIFLYLFFCSRLVRKSLGIFLYRFFAHGWLEKAWAFFVRKSCPRRDSLFIYSDSILSRISFSISLDVTWIASIPIFLAASTLSARSSKNRHSSAFRSYFSRSSS